jgi:DNA-binding NarL/FixJ family response regulator
LRPDIVVMDLLLPGGIDGIETTRRVRGRARVVALTASTDEARMSAVLRAGAAGYVRKDADPETLLAAVRAVAAGKRYIDPNAAGALAAPGEALSPREIDVLRLLARGHANKKIAAALRIGEETVKTHVSNLIAKLGAENRTEVIVQALRRGVLAREEMD